MAGRIVISAELLRSYRRGKISIADAAEWLGCSASGARKALARAGVEFFARGSRIEPSGPGENRRARRQLLALLRWARKQGYSVADLAAVIGVRPQTVRNWTATKQT